MMIHTSETIQRYIDRATAYTERANNSLKLGLMNDYETYTQEAESARNTVRALMADNGQQWPNTAPDWVQEALGDDLHIIAGYNPDHILDRDDMATDIGDLLGEVAVQMSLGNTNRAMAYLWLIDTIAVSHSTPGTHTGVSDWNELLTS